MAQSAPLTPPTNNSISSCPQIGTFAHKTSPAVVSQITHINTDTPAINAAPVELDGIPKDPETVKRRALGGSAGLGDEKALDGDLDGVREKRAAMLASRSKDPGVIVDLPAQPSAEEVEAAKSAEGLITPSALH